MERHDFDALAFLSGLVFAGAGLVLLGGGAIPGGLALPWAGPAVAVGVAFLIVVAVRPRAKSHEGAKSYEEDDALEDGPTA